jgi:hypothetical protein
MPDASGPQAVVDSGLVSGEALVSGVQSVASAAASSNSTPQAKKSTPVPQVAAAPTVPVSSTPFDGDSLASSAQPAQAAELPSNAAITTIKTSPKATASATVAEPAAVATSSQLAVQVAKASTPARISTPGKKVSAPTSTVSPEPGQQVPVATTQVNIGQTSVQSSASKSVANGGQSVEVADLAGASSPSGGNTSILHQVGDGQISIIGNSMNNITVRQSTRINLTVENFVKTHDMVRLQRSLENTARLAGIASLRR